MMAAAGLNPITLEPEESFEDEREGGSWHVRLHFPFKIMFSCSLMKHCGISLLSLLPALAIFRWE